MTYFPFILRNVVFRVEQLPEQRNCYGELVKNAEPERKNHGWEEPITNEEVKEKENGRHSGDDA